MIPASFKRYYQQKIAGTPRLSFLSIALLPLALIYRFGYAWRESFLPKGYYRKRKAARPVVSVGNITCGGTGKTPFILYLHDYFKRHGKRSAVLTRGYGRDETRMLQETMGEENVIIGADRYKKAKQYLRQHDTDVFLMDDGFQHRGLARDCNIVLINGMNPFGNGLLVPAGTLREPLSMLRRADLVVITHADELMTAHERRIYRCIEKIEKKYKKKIPVVRSRHAPDSIYESATKGVMRVEQLRGKQVIAFCGLGFADGFKKTLERIGVELIEFVTLADHEPYTEEAVTQLSDMRYHYPRALYVTTEKDFVRNPHLLAEKLQVRVLKIKIACIEGEEFLHGRLAACSHR